MGKEERLVIVNPGDVVKRVFLEASHGVDQLAASGIALSRQDPTEEDLANIEQHFRSIQVLNQGIAFPFSRSIEISPRPTVSQKTPMVERAQLPATTTEPKTPAPEKEKPRTSPISREPETPDGYMTISWFVQQYGLSKEQKQKIQSATSNKIKGGTLKRITIAPKRFAYKEEDLQAIAVLKEFIEPPTESQDSPESKKKRT